MDFFTKTKAIKLRSHLNKYLVANEDQETVCQSYAGSSRGAIWLIETAEGSEGSNVIRLKSFHGTYLTASDVPILLGVIGKRVTQSFSADAKTGGSSSIEWEPIRGGFLVKLRTKHGKFLRANGGTLPWRNSVSHDGPLLVKRSKGCILWGVEAAVDVCLDHMPPALANLCSSNWSSKQSSNNSEGSSSPQKVEGRTIYYQVATEEQSDEEEVSTGLALAFKGNGVDELTVKLEEETGLRNIIVCTRSPLDGQLYPLRLQLPPNSIMHVVIVPKSFVC